MAGKMTESDTIVVTGDHLQGIQEQVANVATYVDKADAENARAVRFRGKRIDGITNADSQQNGDQYLPVQRKFTHRSP
jgi:hypothetical protein